LGARCSRSLQILREAFLETVGPAAKLEVALKAGVVVRVAASLVRNK
jgi:hypothetical protein